LHDPNGIHARRLRAWVFITAENRLISSLDRPPDPGQYFPLTF
jgi:hypothetical protein